MVERIIAGRYELHDELGAGGMGTVYRGLDLITEQVVAIKQLKSQIAQPDTIERFKREGEALRSLNHPNIVKILNAVEDESHYYLIMEYISGGDLASLLKQGQMPIETVLKFSIDLADALTRAHKLNIIHRDLKPANVLIGEDHVLRLTDFGVAYVGSQQRITDTDAIIGTIDYLPPEAFNGSSIDIRADIWAFGLMLFEMLTGKRPFVAESLAATVTAILTAPLPDLEASAPNAPIALVDLIYRMLERDPQMRIASVRHVGAALEDILEKRDTSSFLLNGRFATSISESQDRLKHNLPAQTTSFVGREGEVTELVSLLDNPSTRLVTLLGPGGMGKTRLALTVGEKLLAAFTDGIFLIELAPLSDATGIVPAIAEAIGYHFQPDHRPPKQLLLDYLRHKQILLLLDNFEHLLEGASLVSEILQAALQTKILTTSRQRLSQTGEVLFHLSGLAVSKEESSQEGVESAAVKLFISSAKRANPNFAPGEDDLKDVVQICHLVQGMPLGILLAAGWAGMLTPCEISAEISHSFDLLETDETELPARQRSIRAVMDYSWQTMTDMERDVSMRLAIFKGGFTREAAQDVAGANLRVLMSLINKSLIRREVSSGRYQIHELLRQHAEQQLHQKNAFYATQQSHAGYFAHWMEKTGRDLRGEKLMETVALIKDEFENVRTAWFYHVERTAVEPLMRMQADLWIYFHIANLFDEAITFYAKAANALAKVSEQTQELRINHAILQAKQGMALDLRGRHEEALGLVTSSQQTLAAFDLVDGYTELFLIWSESGRGNAERYQAAKHAITYFLQHDSTNWYLPLIYMTTALVAADLKKIDEAEAHLNNSIRLLKYTNPLVQAWHYQYSANVYISTHNYQKAISDLHRANDHFLQMNDVMGLYYSSIALAQVYSHVNQINACIAHMAKALKVSILHKLLHVIPETLQRLCQLLLENGEAGWVSQIYQAGVLDPTVSPLITNGETTFPDTIKAGQEHVEAVLPLLSLVDQLMLR